MSPHRTSRAKRDLTAVPDLDDELDRLYGLGLEEFTAARNDLAKRLAAAGLPDAADRVKALRKPSVPTWAVNRLARAQRADVAAFARAGEALVEAQQQALAGDRERFATAREEHGDRLRTLTALAAELLAEEGRTATQATRERIGETLRAASLDPDARTALVAGRLEGDVDARGFSLLAGIEVPAAGKTSRAARRDDRRARAAELKRHLREAQSEARDLRRRADRERRDADRARAEAERAEERAADAERAAAGAEGTAAELERQLDELSG